MRRKGLFKADAVNEEDPERDRATQVQKTCSAVLRSNDCEDNTIAVHFASAVDLGTCCCLDDVQLSVIPMNLTRVLARADPSSYDAFPKPSSSAKRLQPSAVDSSKSISRSPRSLNLNARSASSPTCLERQASAAKAWPSSLQKAWRSELRPVSRSTQASPRAGRAADSPFPRLATAFLASTF